MIPATREKLISLINSVGVPLPSDTRLTDVDLEKRLRDALDATQYIRKSFPNLEDGEMTIDIASLPKYTPVKGSNVKSNLQRLSRNELNANKLAAERGVPQEAAAGQEAFFELRRTLITLGEVWDKKRRLHVIQDEGHKSSMCIRLIEVREAGPNTPVLILLYSHDMSHRPPIVGLPWIQRHMRAGTRPPETQASQDEQSLLLRLLDMNSKRIPASYKPRRELDERKFTLSFILPVGPIDSKEVGRFTRGACAVCTAPATATCSACHSIYYCGPEHQKSDWKSHKKACRSLSDAPWDGFTFVHHYQNPLSPYKAGDTVSWVNNKSPTDSGIIEMALTEEMLTSSPAPPNVHGSNMFLVKMQMGGFHTPFGLTRQFLNFYDEERTFFVTSLPIHCGEDLWQRLDSTLERLGSLEGVKLFVWAKRTGDWELSVTLDPLPDQNIPW